MINLLGLKGEIFCISPFFIYRNNIYLLNKYKNKYMDHGKYK